MPGRLSAQLEAVRQRTAATEAALHAELASVRLQLAGQVDQRHNTPTLSACLRSQPSCDNLQLGMGCEDDSQKTVSEDSTDHADCEHIAALLSAMDDEQDSGDCSLPLVGITSS